MGADHDAVGYPPPPWRLVGPAVVCLGTVDVARARAFVPDDLEIVEVRPGRTVGALVVADYGRGATLAYSELSIMAALVRCRGVRGPWISHIWVDSPSSLQGGREMWGMYKHMAVFDWTLAATSSVVVRAGDQRLATVTWPAPRRLWPAPAWIRGIGTVGGDRRRFTGRGISRLGRCDAVVDIPEESPFAALGLQRQKLRTVAGRMNLLFGDVRILLPPPVTPTPAAPSGRTT